MAFHHEDQQMGATFGWAPLNLAMFRPTTSVSSHGNPPGKLSHGFSMERLQSGAQTIAMWVQISPISSTFTLVYDTHIPVCTAQGGSGSFKDRKPIGEVRCCESWMAEQTH